MALGLGPGAAESPRVAAFEAHIGGTIRVAARPEVPPLGGPIQEEEVPGIESPRHHFFSVLVMDEAGPGLFVPSLPSSHPH